MNDIKKNFSLINKNKFGEILTPIPFIKKMFNLFYLDKKDNNIFKNKNLKWLDTGSGTGNFSEYLFNLLNINLTEIIKNEEERKDHIIENMIYMVEINENNVKILKNKFGEKANIYQVNYIEEDFIQDTDLKNILFDVIIGNPPFNFNGIKKTPTNKIKEKKLDGKTVWMDFVKKSISLLKTDGKLLYIIPSIWLKPDKDLNYYYLLQYKIHYLHTLSNTETNKIFYGEAQTPTCYFLLSKKQTDNSINIYDKCINKYINYKLKLDKPIPLFGQSVINKLQKFLNKVGSINIYKTNLPNKKVVLNEIYEKDKFTYKNIKTCVLKNKCFPELIINYSNIPLTYNNIPKLIFAHKMYGFPYLDISGEYGISNRDNYVIISNKNNITSTNNENYTIDDLKQIQKFLSTKTALYIFESTRYRMKFLEKFAFELIPDITKLKTFTKNINDITDEYIYKYFNFNDNEIYSINNLHRKQYKFFV